ncbi:MAG: rRNA pseudouridine synthase [Alphaproteobacteria bacterium]|nr:MAG: rRNA pseudouridine synthase [Alphaproteobacteria bacterium]
MPGGHPDQSGERIAKVIARAGVCSRREAERLIAAGRVSVDGSVVTTPAMTVTPQATVAIDGTALPARAPTRLWRYHKPRGVVTTAHDPQGRSTVFDRLPPDLPRVLTIGRLDLSSEGLLLLTNDGALQRRLELPATGWTRRYRVRVHGRVDPTRLAALAEGITVAGVTYGPIEAVLERRTGANAWLSVALKEGKNREIRRVMEHLGLTVNRLIRVAYGPFQLGRLRPGQVAEVPAKVLREQLGLPAPGDDERRATGPKVGTAKAKPRPVRPGRRKATTGPAKSGGGEATPKTGRRHHAHRRRPT